MRRLSAIVFAITCACFVRGGEAAVNIAIDIDSTRTSGSATDGLIATQPGFVSWDLTNVIGAGGSTITEQGATFEIFGISNNQSRYRATGGGGSENDLLTDFVFNEGAQGRAVGLRISGLPAGLYAMQSWHYDSTSTVIDTENFIQVEVRDPGGSPTILVDKFPFQTAPTTFQLQIDSDGQVKEVIFREDDEANPAGDAGDQNRARLNGFTLVTVPEPASMGLSIIGIVLLGALRRKMIA